MSANTEDRLPIRKKPDAEAPIQSLLILEQPFTIQQVAGAWVLLNQGSVSGWVLAGRLRPIACIPVEGRWEPSWTDFPQKRYSAEETPLTDLQGFVRFAAGDYERARKMSDIFYRDRIVSVSSEWGPLFYLKTQYFYVRGVSLIKILDNRVRLGIAKRRLYFNRIYGSLCSDEFLRVAVDSNSGWLGNRDLFDKGREYFVEVSVHF